MKTLILFLILIFTFQFKSISQFEGIYYEDRFDNDFKPTIDYSDYEYSYFTSRILRFRQGPLLFDFYSPLYVGFFPMYSPFYMNSFWNPYWNYNLYNPYLFNRMMFNSSWDYVYFNRFNRWNHWNHWNHLGQNTPFNKNIFVSNTIINNQPSKQFASRNTSVSRINTQSGRQVVQSPRTARTPVQSNNQVGRVNRPQSTTVRGNLNNSSTQRQQSTTMQRSHQPTQRQQSTTTQRSHQPTQRQQSTTTQRSHQPTQRRVN